MASNATRIMVRSSNRDWSSPQVKPVLQKPSHVTSKVATVKPVAKNMSSSNGQDRNGFGSTSDEEKSSPTVISNSRKESDVGEKDALVVELEKCLTELENDPGSHATLADDYSKIEKEKDDLLSELEVTFQELEEYMSHVKELEAEKKEIVEERDELTAQVENLKYCLAGRQEIQDQQSGWKDKKMKLEEEIQELKEKNETLQEEANSLYEERQSLINSLLNLNSEQVNEVIKTRSRSSSTVSTDSSASFFLRGENEELTKYLHDAEEAEEKALNELQESKVHVMALQQTVSDQEGEINELKSANERLTSNLENVQEEKEMLQQSKNVMDTQMDNSASAVAKEIEDLKSELESLQKDLASKRALLHSQSRKDDETRQRIESLESEITTLKKEIGDLKDQLKDKCIEVDNANKTYATQSKDAQERIENVSKEKSKLDAKLKEAESVSAQLKDNSVEIQKLTGELLKVKSSAVLAEDKIKSLVSDKSAADNTIKDLRLENQTLQKDVHDLKASNEMLSQNYSNKNTTNEKLLQTMKDLESKTKEANDRLQELTSENKQLVVSLDNAKSQNEKLSEDNHGLNKRILESHKQKIESLESLLDNEKKKVHGFDERVEALSLQVDGDKKQLKEVQQENEKLTVTINTLRADNAKLRENAKRQRMASNSVQELVQHKLREEKQSLEQRCEALQSALDKANTENKCVLQQLEAVNESSAVAIRDLKTKKNEAQLELDSLRQKHEKIQEELSVIQKEVDSYESFNKAHVDRKLEASGQGNSLLGRLQSSEGRLQDAKARVAQLETDNQEYPKKLEESETLINDLQRALSHANDLAMEKSLEVSRSKRNLEKKMEKILKENIDLKRKLFVEGVPYTSSSSSGAAPFHSRGQLDASQTPMYEPKNDQKLGFSSAVDLRRIDAPAVIKKTELMTFAQLATPTMPTKETPGGRSRVGIQSSSSFEESPPSRRASSGIVQDLDKSGGGVFSTPKTSMESPPVKPPPPAFYEARLKKTSTKRDTPHPDKMYHHRTQLSLDGSMDELAAGKLLSETNKALQGGRLEHWV